MSYVRTEEIRNKQRIKMLEISKNYDFAEIDRKRKATIKRNNIKTGRPKGQGKPKNGYSKPCKMCDTLMWVTPKVQKKYCSKKCMHIDPEYRQLLRDAPHPGHPRGKNPDTPNFRYYKNLVHRLSHKVYIQNKEVINPNNYPRTLCGVEGGYQLDHIKPISECYKLGMKPEDVAMLSNLRMLPWKQNVGRNKKLSSSK